MWCENRSSVTLSNVISCDVKKTRTSILQGGGQLSENWPLVKRYKRQYCAEKEFSLSFCLYNWFDRDWDKKQNKPHVFHYVQVFKHYGSSQWGCDLFLKCHLRKKLCNRFTIFLLTWLFSKQCWKWYLIILKLSCNNSTFLCSINEVPLKITLLTSVDILYKCIIMN